MYDIVSLGSATIDVFVRTAQDSRKIISHAKHPDVCLPVGAKVLVDDLFTSTGGAGTNTAVAFARLGLKTAWIGPLGKDRNAQEVVRALRHEKVDSHPQYHPGRTGYSVVLTGLKHDRTVLAFKGVNDTLSSVHLPATKWLYCGSFLGAAWHAAVKAVIAARRANVRVAFNPSLYLAKKGMRALAPVLKHLDVLILNKEEASALLGKNGTIAELAHRLTKHIKVAVVTDGEHGVVASDGYFAYSLKPKHVRVTESTGAGDAFASGFVAGMLWNKTIPDCLRLGHAEAVSVLSGLGAKTHLLSKAKALSTMKKFKVTVVAQ